LIKKGCTYQFIEIPSPMLSSLLHIRHSLIDFEVPVHMGGLFFLTFFIWLKSSSALVAWLAKLFIEFEDEMWSRSTKSECLRDEVNGGESYTYSFKDAGFNSTSLGISASGVLEFGGVFKKGGGGGGGNPGGTCPAREAN
jgi:hypothetical protein